MNQKCKEWKKPPKEDKVFLFGAGPDKKSKSKLSNVEMLQGMYPDVPVEILQSILAQFHYKVELAVHYLMEICDSKQNNDVTCPVDHLKMDCVETVGSPRETTLQDILDEEFAVKIFEEWNFSEDNGGKMSFQNIMDEELAKQLSETEPCDVDCDKKENNESFNIEWLQLDTLASKLKHRTCPILTPELIEKRMQLYKLFPDIPSSTLDCIFETSNYEFQTCIVWMQEMNIDLHIPVEHKRPKNLPSSGVVLVLEDLVYAMIQKQSIVLPVHSHGFKSLQQEAEFYALKIRTKSTSLVSDCAAAMKNAREKAAVTIFYELNKHLDLLSKIDLHHLFVHESIRVLRTVVMQFSPNRRLSIITGSGTHSVSKTSKLKPAIRSYLLQLKVKFSEQDGGFIVSL